MIETVLGPIEAGSWGPTSMHDHLASDSSALRREGVEPAPIGLSVEPEHYGYLRWNMLALADNLRMDTPDLIADELMAAVAAGQHAMVESTSWGLGPSHSVLPDIARRSGMSVVCSYGAYIPRTLPAWVAAMGEHELERHLEAALTVRVPDTDYRAGILGIMGTTAELLEEEIRMLRAAARAAVSTGAAVTVRLEPEQPRGIEVLRIMAAEGLPADRVVFTNADEFMGRAVWSDLSAAGAVLEMSFGTEAIHAGRVDNPSDRERLAFLAPFATEHPEARIVLGQSTWTKTQLRRHGGYGYGHLLGRIVPELARRGISRSRLQTMLVDEPVRLLDRPSPLKAIGDEGAVRTAALKGRT